MLIFEKKIVLVLEKDIKIRRQKNKIKAKSESALHGLYMESFFSPYRFIFFFPIGSKFILFIS